MILDKITLPTIINCTFENEIGRYSEYAMDISFVLKSKKMGIHFLDIRIFAPANYVGVLSKEKLVTFNEYELRTCEPEPWEIFEYHPTEWRVNGVRQLISNYHEKIKALWTTSKNWYIKHKVTERELKIFRDMI